MAEAAAFAEYQPKGGTTAYAAFIDEEAFIYMTPKEADEIAAKLNSDPGTIVPGSEK